MIDVLIYWTGVAVWVAIVMYVAPIIPVVLLALFEAVLQRIGLWWSDRYISEEEVREMYGEVDNRTEVYMYLRDQGRWETKLNIAEHRVRSKVKAVRKSLMETVDRYWYTYLPTL